MQGKHHRHLYCIYIRVCIFSLHKNFLGNYLLPKIGLPLLRQPRPYSHHLELASAQCPLSPFQKPENGSNRRRKDGRSPTGEGKSDNLCQYQVVVVIQAVCVSGQEQAKELKYRTLYPYDDDHNRIQLICTPSVPQVWEVELNTGQPSLGWDSQGKREVAQKSCLSAFSQYTAPP